MSNKIHSIFEETNGVEKLETWLGFTEIKLKENDYIRYNQKHKDSDFQYWKTFNVEGKKAYQIGVLFYDFRKYAEELNAPETINIQFECLITDIEGNVGMTISKENVMLKDFETLSKDFYYTMSSSIKNISSEELDYSMSVLRPIVIDLIRKHNITNNRERKNVYRRNYIYYFLRNELKRKISFKKIGDIFGYDHATVIHGEKQAKSFLEDGDILFLDSINELKEDLFSKFEEELKK
jgi:hypothetical protein